MNREEMKLPNAEIDEKLWIAYRREDKAAVTDYLFRRTLLGVSRSTSFPQFRINTVPKRRGSDPMRTNPVAGQISLRYAR